MENTDQKQTYLIPKLIVFTGALLGPLWLREWLWWQVVTAPSIVLGTLVLFSFVVGMAFGKWFWYET